MSDADEVEYTQDSREYKRVLTIFTYWAKRTKLRSIANSDHGDIVVDTFTKYMAVEYPNVTRLVSADGGLFHAVAMQWNEMQR